MSGAGSGAGATSVDAAAATVAPLLALWRRSRELHQLRRLERALQLAERALEQAQRTLARGNLVAPWMLDNVLYQRVHIGNEKLAATAGAGHMLETAGVAWASEARLKTWSHDQLATCCARLEAGTLQTPTPEERAFFGTPGLLNAPPLERLGDEALLSATVEAVTTWNPVTPQELALLRTGMEGTLQAALALDAQGELVAWMQKRELVRYYVPVMLECALVGQGANTPSGECGRVQLLLLSPACEAAARRLQARLQKVFEPHVSELGHSQWVGHANVLAAWKERGDADVARHGLRACALPSCGAAEPHPRFFKCCSRCRAVYYCCAEHQRADWSRHRRADTCAKAAAS